LRCRPAPETEDTVTFSFRLISREGDDVGVLKTAAPDWGVGSEFTTGDRRRFRLLDVVNDEGDETAFVVEPLEDTSA
jgi:hypothetical protein